MSQTFTVSLYNSTAINLVDVSFGPNGTAPGSCKIEFGAGGYAIGLSHPGPDNGEIWTWWYNWQPTGSLSNDYCTVTAWSGNFPNPTVSITFKTTMLGTQTVQALIQFRDEEGNLSDTGWNTIGSWTVAVPTLSAISVSLRAARE